MLVVTFGRAASQELRERVRAQLVEAERVLSDDPAAALPDDVPPSELVDAAAGLGRRASGGSGTVGSPRRSPGSTRRRSRPPTSSARWCSTRSGSPATPTHAPGSSRTSTTWSRRPSTTSTCGRSPSTRRGRCSPTPRRWRSPGPRSTTRRSRLEPDAEDRTTPVGRRVSFATRRPHRARQAQAAARDPVLRRPAQPAPRRARRRRQPGGRADAAALVDRAGRRVPGHRPGAVGGPRPRVHRARHDGADRRPEAGDLRLPRRRRHDLPPGGPHRGDQADARRSTGAATPPW